MTSYFSLTQEFTSSMVFLNNQFIPATGVKDSKESSYSLSGPRAVPGTVKFTEFVKF